MISFSVECIYTLNTHEDKKYPCNKFTIRICRYYILYNCLGPSCVPFINCYQTTETRLSIDNLQHLYVIHSKMSPFLYFYNYV